MWVKNSKIKEKSNQLYQLKITLKDIKPAIWRRFEVRSDVMLARLHEYIQVIMGWDNCHMHQFIIGNVYYGQPHPDYDDMGEQMEDEKKYKLCDLVGVKGKLMYEYDFGDGWMHEIKVEKMIEAQAGVKYPVCTAGARSCPPDDCGGPWGYENMLKILNDPDHDDYEDISDWIGDDFDPEEFDIDEINKTLSKC